MKKILSLASLLMIAGITTACYADALNEGNTALEQKKYSDAITSFTKACDGGNAKGCFQLGAMYENGEGVAQNKYKASTLYAQACRAKEMLGCSNMSLKYDTP
ncbi:MAG: hypothetical protein NT103_07790 [Campylobacterales bacterium]|nr:hypothetical protein [Campylobacterales bacterium]